MSCQNKLQEGTAKGVHYRRIHPEKKGARAKKSKGEEKVVWRGERWKFLNNKKVFKKISWI